jgi:replication factor C subunit 3/5
MNENNVIVENKTITNAPWVEKYRPKNFENIVLDPINRQIFTNILQKNYFPNLLFYGPPGTGKTTTVINLINEFQLKYYGKSKGTVIHLNASDERGIDIIRNQIHQFVKSKNLFEIGFKFVILDEVDYMTKNAQQALKTLLNTYTSNVRFCLICNYISKIDESLQNEFICIRFNQLPKQDIYMFIKKIIDAENLDIDETSIDAIQTIYNSDIRSMINFIQLNQNLDEWGNTIIKSTVWEKLHEMIKNENCKDVLNYIHTISIQYNMDKKNIIQTYFNYILRNHGYLITPKYLDIITSLIHATDVNIESILNYFCNNLQNYYTVSV